MYALSNDLVHKLDFCFLLKWYLRQYVAATPSYAHLNDEEEWDPEVVTVIERSPGMCITGAETLGLKTWLLVTLTEGDAI